MRRSCKKHSDSPFLPAELGPSQKVSGGQHLSEVVPGLDGHAGVLVLLGVQLESLLAHANFGLLGEAHVRTHAFATVGFVVELASLAADHAEASVSDLASLLVFATLFGYAAPSLKRVFLALLAHADALVGVLKEVWFVPLLAHALVGLLGEALVLVPAGTGLACLGRFVALETSLAATTLGPLGEALALGTFPVNALLLLLGVPLALAAPLDALVLLGRPLLALLALLALEPPNSPPDYVFRVISPRINPKLNSKR